MSCLFASRPDRTSPKPAIRKFSFGTIRSVGLEFSTISAKNLQKSAIESLSAYPLDYSQQRRIVSCKGWREAAKDGKLAAAKCGK